MMTKHEFHTLVHFCDTKGTLNQFFHTFYQVFERENSEPTEAELMCLRLASEQMEMCVQWKISKWVEILKKAL